jgi:hypothetical protein
LDDPQRAESVSERIRSSSRQYAAITSTSSAEYGRRRKPSGARLELTQKTVTTPATQVHPLALNAQQLRPQIEDQVVSLVSKWSKDSDSELDCSAAMHASAIAPF